MATNFFGKGATDFGLAGKYANALKAAPKSAFSPQNPQEWLEYKQGLIKKGYSLEDVNAAMERYGSSSTSNTPEGKLVEGIVPLMQKQMEQNIWASSPEGMDWMLKKANETSRQKAKQALMWQTLANLPETMAIAASPYGGPVGAAMAYQGVAAIPGIYSSTLASYPTLQIPGSSVQQYRYF